MRSAAQRAAQLKAAKASALARKKKSLNGRSSYADSQSGMARGGRTYTRQDYNPNSSSGRMTRMGLDKPKIVQSQAAGQPSRVTVADPRRKAMRSIEATGRRVQNVALHGISQKIGMRDPKLKK